MKRSEIEAKIASLYDEWDNLLILARSKIGTEAWNMGVGGTRAIYIETNFLLPYEPQIERIKQEIDYYTSLNPTSKLGF